MISHKDILWSLFDSFKQEVTESAVSASLKLAEVCIEKLSLRYGINLICLAIKLLFSSIQHWQSGPVDGETANRLNGTNAFPKERYIRKLSVKLVSKLKRTLDHNMPDDYQSDALTTELEVRYYNLHCIVMTERIISLYIFIVL